MATHNIVFVVCDDLEAEWRYETWSPFPPSPGIKLRLGPDLVKLILNDDGAAIHFDLVHRFFLIFEKKKVPRPVLEALRFVKTEETKLE